MGPLLRPDVSEIARSASTPPATRSPDTVPPSSATPPGVGRTNNVAYHHMAGFVTPPVLPTIATRQAIGRPSVSDGRLHSESPSPPSGGPSTPSGSTALDNMSRLQRMDFILKARNGSVLSRGCILKTDHYPTGTPPMTFWLNSEEHDLSALT